MPGLVLAWVQEDLYVMARKCIQGCWETNIASPELHVHTLIHNHHQALRTLRTAVYIRKPLTQRTDQPSLLLPTGAAEAAGLLGHPRWLMRWSGWSGR